MVRMNLLLLFLSSDKYYRICISQTFGDILELKLISDVQIDIFDVV